MLHKPKTQATGKAKLSTVVLLAFTHILLSACASVPMASEQQRSTASNFKPPNGEAGLYVYRQSGFVGSAVVHPVYLDGRILGNNGPGTFLFTTLQPGRHIVSAGVTQVPIDAAPNGLYFVRQTADMTMVGTLHTSSVRLVSTEQGKRGLRECKQASSNF